MSKLFTAFVLAGIVLGACVLVWLFVLTSIQVDNAKQLQEVSKSIRSLQKRGIDLNK